MTNDQEISNTLPKWLSSLLSLLIGCGALWVAWLQYNDLANQPQLEWYVWIRPVLLLVLGGCCLAALILFMTGSPAAWSMFLGGLSIIPIMLFSNLIVLIFRVIQNLVQGNTDPFLSRFSASPLKVILNIIVVIVVLSVIEALKKKENND